MSTIANTPPVTIGFNPAAGFAAILFPGAGHLLRGEPYRAALIALGVLGLFFGGIFIGGIDVIDRREDSVWFIGQALVGPLAFGADYVHQHHFKVAAGGGFVRSANPNEGRTPEGNPEAGGKPPNIKSLSKVNELGTLFSTIAGMLNVIVILDAAFPATRRKTGREQGAAGAPEARS